MSAPQLRHDLAMICLKNEKGILPVFSGLLALVRFLRASGFLLSDCHGSRIPCGTSQSIKHRSSRYEPIKTYQNSDINEKAGRGRIF